MDARQASALVVARAGSACAGLLNFYDTGGGCMVATVQVDSHVYVVGQDDFTVARYDLAAWLGEADQPSPPAIDCFDAEGAWEMFRRVREGCLMWQCGGCDAWIFTTNHPRFGLLQCSTCCDGGVDFRHADRHVGRDVD